MKYPVNLTLEEMKMIRRALATEALRREDGGFDGVVEYDNLSESFAKAIRHYTEHGGKTK